jgi:hypothetical protein
MRINLLPQMVYNELAKGFKSKEDQEEYEKLKIL